MPAIAQRSQCTAASRERKSVDEPAEEVRVVYEGTSGRRGRRGAFGNVPKVQMNQNSSDDCRILKEVDNANRAVTLWDVRSIMRHLRSFMVF